MSDFKTDPLSAKARQIMKIDVESSYTELVPRQTGSAEAGDILHAISSADLVEGAVKSAEDAACLHSALWLWHDYLDESHTISQKIENATGSFWHAIMHRREGDFGNSKYWYAKCGAHPILRTLAAQARDIVSQAPADKSLVKLTMTNWNGAAFVDFVQSVHESPSDPRYAIAVTLQQLEWRTLFDYCTRLAAGK